MKKPLPTAAIVAAVVLAVSVAGLLFFKAGSGQAEFATPNVPKVVPKYVYDMMPPTEQKRYRDEGYKIDGGAPPKMGGNPVTP